MKKKKLRFFIIGICGVFLFGCFGPRLRPYANEGYVQGQSAIRYRAFFWDGTIVGDFNPYETECMATGNSLCYCFAIVESQILSCKTQLTPSLLFTFYVAGFNRDWDEFFKTHQLIIGPPINTGLLTLERSNRPSIKNIMYYNNTLTVNLQQTYYFRRERIFFSIGAAYYVFIEITRITTLVDVVYTGGEFITSGWDEDAIEIFMLHD